MSVTARDMTIFEELDNEEWSMVSSYASSLIRNRGENTEAYEWFQAARERMLKKNPMSDEEIDVEIHRKDA